jgi:16S rRNA (guanine527-N7)-methyltransferase
VEHRQETTLIGGPSETSKADLTAQLGRYAAAVRACPHNLMSRAGLEELEERHIPESVRFAERLPRNARVVDIGAGGGLPGLVIAIVRRDLEVHLVESTGKKAAFLEETAALLGIDAKVHHARVEEVSKGPLGNGFDVVTARAVAPLDRLVDLAVPLLRPGGSLFAIKGSRWGEELAEAQGRIRHHGLVLVDQPDAETPGLGGPLVLVLRRPEDGPK